MINNVYTTNERMRYKDVVSLVLTIKIVFWNAVHFILFILFVCLNIDFRFTNSLSFVVISI